MDLSRMYVQKDPKMLPWVRQFDRFVDIRRHQ